MKIWIVGVQGTEKISVANLLTESEKDLKIGKLFTNLPQDSETTIQLYSKELYKFYTRDDVNEIFENNAYVFLNNLPHSVIDYYEGLDLNEFDSNNVFVLSPAQFISVNIKYISKDDLIVWLDGTYEWRISNIRNYNNNYDYIAFEKEERSVYESFFSMMTNLNSNCKNILYFCNEIPERVKTIVKVIYNNPKLKNEFIKNFNQ